jgi:hypothetical protein
VSISIFIREVDMRAYLAKEDGSVFSLTLADGLRFPNLHAAKDAWERVPAQNRSGMRVEMVAADPEQSCDERDIEPMGEIEELVEVSQTPLRGAVELFAMLKKSSKYFRQFDGWSKVTAVIAPSYGDVYCFRVAHNAYRHEDLIFAVKLPNGEMCRLDKWCVTKSVIGGAIAK